MKVVAFPRGKQGEQDWRSSELDRLLPACAARNSDVQSFSVGSTERGDPQLYVLGPEPEYECILCVTRLGNLYVMEDGTGRLVVEHTNLALLAEQIPVALSRRRAALIAKFVLLWAAVRQTVEQKIEPLLAEPMELATHFVPQFAALA